MERCGFALELSGSLLSAVPCGLSVGILLEDLASTHSAADRKLRAPPREAARDAEARSQASLSATARLNKGRVLTRNQLLDAVWGADYFGEDRIVDTHIKNLRKKLAGDYIDTIRGVGYRIDKIHKKQN